MNPVLEFIILLATYFAIYNILTLGLNLQFGYAGIPNFSYVVFLAAGAYFTGVTGLPRAPAGLQYILGLSWPFPLTLLAGAVAAGALGFGLGLVTLRRLTSDYHLAIVIFGLGFIAYDFVSNYVPAFNGFDGIYGIQAPLSTVLPLDYNTYPFFFLGLTVVIMLFLWWVARRIHNSAMGRTLRAIRDDLQLAEALGKNSWRFRMMALVLGCVFAGVAGGLTVEYISAMNPSAWTEPETFVIWAAMIVGGRANNAGSAIGTLLIPILLLEATTLIPIPPELAVRGDALRLAVVGVVLLVVLWYRPQGVLPERRRFFELPLGLTVRLVDQMPEATA
jgi:branched-chain amino acid transport system permease protein